MAVNLKSSVINMKTLSQDIADPVVVGGGDVNGRTLKIIFTQEAAARLTPKTKVYLSWYHQQADVKGYNVFTKLEQENEDDPPTWEITYPKAMLHEGDVLACIELVDDISISTTVNFMIHVLADPNDGSHYVATDDFSEFQQAVISLTCLADQMKDQMVAQKIEFEDMQLEFMQIYRIVHTCEENSTLALQKAEQALEKATETEETVGTLEQRLELAEVIVQTAVEATSDLATQVQENKDLIESLAQQIVVFQGDIERVKQEAIDESKQYTDEEIEKYGGVSITEF